MSILIRFQPWKEALVERRLQCLPPHSFSRVEHFVSKMCDSKTANDPPSTGNLISYLQKIMGKEWDDIQN